MADRLCKLLTGTHSRVESGERVRYATGSTIVLSDEELKSDTFKGRVEILGGGSSEAVEATEEETAEETSEEEASEVATPTPRRKRY